MSENSKTAAQEHRKAFELRPPDTAFAIRTRSAQRNSLKFSKKNRVVHMFPLLRREPIKKSAPDDNAFCGLSNLYASAWTQKRKSICRGEKVGEIGYSESVFVTTNLKVHMKNMFFVTQRESLVGIQKSGQKSVLS